MCGEATGGASSSSVLRSKEINPLLEEVNRWENENVWRRLLFQEEPSCWRIAAGGGDSGTTTGGLYTISGSAEVASNASGSMGEDEEKDGEEEEEEDEEEKGDAPRG